MSELDNDSQELLTKENKPSIVPWKVSKQVSATGQVRFILHLALEKEVLTKALEAASQVDTSREWTPEEKAAPLLRYKECAILAPFRLGSENDVMCIEVYDKERCPLDQTGFGTELERLKERDKSGIIIPGQ